MSVVRLVTRILPTGSQHEGHLLEASDIGVPLSKEWCHSGNAFVAETTFCKENLLPPHADIDAASACHGIGGLVCLKKSRLRLTSEEEQPRRPRRGASLVRVCPEMLEDGTCGGILLSIPLRIARSDLAPPDRRKRFLCEVCGKGFDDAGLFSEHCGRHAREGAHPLERFLRGDRCLLCDFVFVSRTEPDIKRHLAAHLSGPQLEWLDELLSDHRRNARPPSPRRTPGRPATFECPCCEARFEGRVALKKHVRTQHPGQLPYLCGECPERFRTLRGLEQHSALHAGRKQFLCDVCGRGFQSQGVFAQHCATHRGDFRCRTCKRVFGSKASFTLHKRSHVRKHCCAACGMRFKFLQHLKNHVATFHQVSGDAPAMGT